MSDTSRPKSSSPYSRSSTPAGRRALRPVPYYDLPGEINLLRLMFSRQLGSFLAADTDGQVEAYLATLDALVSAVDTHASLLRRHDKSYDPRLEWELQVEAGKELARERLGIKDYLVYKPQESP